MAMTTQQIIEQYDKHVIGNYGRLPTVIVRAQGSTMWDNDGKEYLDFFPGWAVSGLGHCHPKVVEAIRYQAGELIHIDNTFHNIPQGRLAEMISTRSFGGKCFFCNSGTEAVEAAIKLARLAGKGERYKMITMEKSFHGRTFGAMSATGQSKTHAGFQPLLPGFSYVPFNDFDAVEKAVDDQTIAIMLEVVQGEGGINIAKPDYLRSLRQLCDDRNMLLIFDEVQTGMGRTGKWFAYQHYDVAPDVMTLAKALGGGVSIGGIVAKPEIAQLMGPGTHAATFGGNPLACAAAVAVIEAIESDDLLAAAEQRGSYLQEKLTQLKNKYTIISEIRRLGLMTAVELSVSGAELVPLALEKGLRINCTQGTVLRLIPVMTITTDEIDRGIEILKSVFETCQRKLVQSQSEG